MKVQDLIAKLTEFDLNAKVVVCGYEDGFTELRFVKQTTIKPYNKKEDEWWLGEYEFSLEPDAEVAILLPRK